MLKVKLRTVEIGAAVALIAIGALIFYESLQLGVWNEFEPEPGFFPLLMTIVLMGGAVVVLALAFREESSETFFEVSQEIVDLLKVGIPVLIYGVSLLWLGIYIASGIYLGFFMIYYGKYKWWVGVLGGALFSVVLWFLFAQLLNNQIRMPLSFLKDSVPF